MAKNLDIVDTMRLIMKDEDAKGRLKKDFFTDEVKNASSELRSLRDEYRKNKSEMLRNNIRVNSEELAQMKAEYIENIVADIRHRVEININDELVLNGKTVYRCEDLQTLLISKYVMRDLAENFHLQMADRNAVIEELHVLLDNNTPKILIRSDIESFFESIPQDRLMEFLKDDARISSYSLKYLQLFLDKFNALKLQTNSEDEAKIGLPRGLCFSSVLSEIYLKEFDIQIQNLPNVYFYKRYVDDIILLLSPSANVDKTITSLKDALASISLIMNADKTESVKITEDVDMPLTFTYLGYKFVVDAEKTELHLSDKKCGKYKYLIDQIFAVYNKTNHFRRQKAKGEKKKDALVTLKREINALTGNGLLDQKRNFVHTGIFYSNRLLTSTAELEELDDYLGQKIDAIHPARNLFQFDGEDQYEERLTDIKRMLHKYTFVTGFVNRRECNPAYFKVVLSILKKIYRGKNE